MSALSQKCRVRVGKLIVLMGSDVDAEALAAVRAIRNALAAEGRDMHAVADLIIGRPSWGRLSDRERDAWLRVLLREPRLSATDHAKMRALLQSGVSHPAKDDARIFNKWSGHLHAEGVRP